MENSEIDALDFVAMQAMAAIIANFDYMEGIREKAAEQNIKVEKIVAIGAYSYADAMLEESKRRKARRVG